MPAACAKMGAATAGGLRKTGGETTCGRIAAGEMEEIAAGSTYLTAI